MMGQHIRVLKGGRWVHAVDCGDETVLHLAEEAPPPRVRRAYRPEFVAGAEAVEVVTHRERTYPASEIVRRAYSRASDPALAAMFQDSEAFADWCTTGRLGSGRNVAVEVPGVGPPAPGAAKPVAKVKAKARASKPAAKVKARARAVAPKPAGKAKRPARATKPVARRTKAAKRGRG